jgi:pumilio homology domain family member 6
MVSVKDRKDIIKVLKPYIVTMAKDEDAQLVLFTAFDVIEYVESLLWRLHPVTNVSPVIRS